MIKIPYVNVAPCMKGSASEGLFNAPSLGGHYSPKGNREAANCLFQEVNSNLGERFSELVNHRKIHSSLASGALLIVCSSRPDS